ncbi:MAG: hydrogenase formation protein HypD [Chloroflexi bacterium]|nr:hydrogenase formation protein HypD [Chloroflexota bacterium]
MNVEFRDPDATQKLVAAIERALPDGQTVKIMHVCGSHERTVSRWGLRSLLPERLEIFAGPGCPVCVCPVHEVGEAIALAERGVILATYGDMLRLPTPYGSLAEAKSAGGDVRIIYSPLDALKLAVQNPAREVVFFSVGFETTVAPTAALLASTALLPDNFSILTSHRLTSPAMELLLGIGDIHIEGFIAPGHVSVIMGSEEWRIFPEAYRMPVVVAGFEPVDILLALLMLLEQRQQGAVRLENEYNRVVQPHGNSVAQAAIWQLFDVQASWWRGIGRIPHSGLVLKADYARYDARERFGIRLEPAEEELPPGCSCHLVMLGKIHPPACPLYDRKCTPTTPYGPCMVSQEGTCFIWHSMGEGMNLDDR